MQKLALVALITLTLIPVAPAATAEPSNRCMRAHNAVLANTGAVRDAVTEAAAAGSVSGIGPGRRLRRYDRVFSNNVGNLSQSLRELSRYGASEQLDALSRDVSRLNIREGRAVSRTELAALAQIAEAIEAAGAEACAPMQTAAR